MPDVIQLGVQTNAEQVIPAEATRGYNKAVQILSKPIQMRIDAAPLGRITGDIKELDKSLAASNARVIAFGATTGVLFGIAEAFRGLVRTTIDVEKELTNIQSILHLSTQSFGQLKSTLFDIAGTTASSFKQVTEVATNFARQGLGMTETLKRTRDALILARETGIDAKEAFSSLTAAVNTFRGEALDSTTIINKLVAVSTNFAVTSADLAEGIKRAGATAQQSKVNFDQLVGAITAIQTATGRGGAVIGTSLQRIFARVESAPTLKALEEVGVRTRELSGDIRPALDILTELSTKFQNLNEVQRNQISTALAGRIQFNQLNSLLRDLARQNSITTAATEKSSGATDEAIRRNNELNTSLSALINKAKESGAALASAFGARTIDPAARGFVQTINKIFDSLRNEQGKDSAGARIGAGIIDGIGNALKGPGTVVISALLVTLFGRVTGYATKAIAELTGLNKNAKEQQGIEAAINELLSNGNREYVQRFQAATSTKEQEAALLKLMEEANIVLQQRVGLYAQLQKEGFGVIGGQLAAPKTPATAGGYIPSAASGLLGALSKENRAIERGVGGASPGAHSVVVPSFNFGGGKVGQIVANTNEYIVKNFAGGQGSAVFNPRMIQAVGGFNNLLGLGRVEKVANQGLISDAAAGFLNSDQFQKWFGESKVVDRAGNPKVVYHGTQAPAFNMFDTNRDKGFMLARNIGTHFAVSPKMTDAFTIGQYAHPSDYVVANRTGESWYRDQRTGDLKYDGVETLRKDDRKNYTTKTLGPLLEEHSRYPQYKLGKEYSTGLIKPGGKTYPVYLSIKNPLVAKKGVSDDAEVSRAIAREVFPKDKGLFIDSVTHSVGINTEEANQMWENFAANRPFRNYKDMDDLVRNHSGIIPDKFTLRAKQLLQKAGYDGIKYQNTSTNEKVKSGSNAVYIAFEPTQIKSAISNSGAFDPSNPDISHAEGFVPNFASYDFLNAMHDLPNVKREEGREPFFEYGEAGVNTRMRSLGRNTAYLDSIEASQPGKGAAGAFMRDLVRLAKQNKTNIKLTAQPFGQKNLNIDQLTKFYSKYGFENVGRRGLWQGKTPYQNMRLLYKNIPSAAGGYIPESTLTEIERLKQEASVPDLELRKTKMQQLRVLFNRSGIPIPPSLLDPSRFNPGVIQARVNDIRRQAQLQQSYTSTGPGTYPLPPQAISTIGQAQTFPAYNPPTSPFSLIGQPYNNPSPLQLPGGLQSQLPTEGLRDRFSLVGQPFSDTRFKLVGQPFNKPIGPQSIESDISQIGLRPPSQEELIKEATARADKERKTILDFYRQEQQRTVRSLFTRDVGDAFSRYGGRKSATFQGLGEISEQGQAEIDRQETNRSGLLRQSRQQKLIGAAFIAPIAAQGAFEGLGLTPDTQSGRIASGITTGLSTGATVTAFGGGPVLGGLTAAFLTLRAIVANTAKSFEEVSKVIDESNHKKQEEASHLEAANQALGNLADILHQGGDPRTIDRATRQANQAIQDVPSQFRRQFATAAGAPTQENLGIIEDLTTKFNDNRTRNERVGESIKRLTLSSQQTSSVGTPNAVHFAGQSLLAPSQATTEAAFQPGSGFGGFLNRFLFNLGAGNNISNAVGINPFRSPTAEDLRKVREQGGARGSDQIQSDIASLKAIPIPQDVLNGKEDLGKTLRDFQSSKDGKEFFANFLKKIGADPKLIKQHIDSLPTNSVDQFTELGAFFRNAQQLQVLSKKVTESQKKTNQSFRDFLNVADDILKDVGHNFDIQSLRQSGDRNIGLRRAQGLLEIGSPSLTPTGIENFQSQNKLQELQNERLDNINKLVGGLTEKFNVPEQALDNPVVQKALAGAAANISKSPDNITSELSSLGQAIQESGVQGGDKIKDKMIEATKEFARALDEENEQYIIKYKAANEEHTLALTKIQVEQQRNFLGGDFTKLASNQFSGTLPILQGLSGLSKLIGTSIIPGIGRADKLTGFEPTVPAFRQLNPLRSGLFDETTGFPVPQRERALLGRRSAAITGLGDQLQSLGLLQNEPETRQKFADIAAQGGIATANNFLNAIKEKAARFGQADLVQLINRQQNNPQLTEAFRLQAAERFKTGSESQSPIVSKLEQQLKYNTALSTEHADQLDPIKQNTLALLTNKTTIEQLNQAIENYTNALINNNQKPSAQTPSEQPPDQQEGQARGFIPNFDAFTKELKDIRLGVGGAVAGDKPYRTFVSGLGSTVVNSGESILRNFMGSGKDAVLNRDMKEAFGYAKGYIPNFENAADAINSRGELIQDLLNENGMPQPSPSPSPKPEGKKSWWKKWFGLSRGYIPNFFEDETVNKDVFNPYVGVVSTLKRRRQAELNYPRNFQIGQPSRSAYLGNAFLAGAQEPSRDHYLNQASTDPVAHYIHQALGYNQVFAKQGPYDSNDAVGQTLQGIRQYQMNSIAQREGYRGYQQLNRYVAGGSLVQEAKEQGYIGEGAKQARLFNIQRAIGRGSILLHHTRSPELQGAIDSGSVRSRTRAEQNEIEADRRANYRNSHTRGGSINSSYQGGGSSRFDENLLNYAIGYMPNFASELNEAMLRESMALRKRGVTNPNDYMFVGQSRGILGVGNTLDESNGLSNPNAGIEQGINRYIRAGRNPRAAGQVPNYALTDDNLTKSIDNLISKLGGYFDKQNAQSATAKGTTPTGEVKHTGNFNVDVSLAANGGNTGNVSQDIQTQVQAALQEFKTSLEQRLASLEKANGQFYSPPIIGSNIGGGATNYLV